MPLRSPVALLAASALLAALPAAARGENYGRVTQPHEIVTTTITPSDDVDDLVFEAAAGWKISAVVKRARTADILPVLELIAPDGSVVTEGVKSKTGKTAAKVSATLLEGGRFALRVRGDGGTGEVTLKWKVKPAKVAKVKNLLLGAETTTDFPFPARGGAEVSWVLKFKGDGAAQVALLRDPLGNDGGYDPEDDTYVVRKLTSEKVKAFPLPASGPGGNWVLRVENKLFPSTASLSVKVKFPKTAASSVTLTAAEPVIESLSNIVGGCGAPVTLTGQNLTPNPQGIYYGTRAATSVAVPSPTSATCKVPSGTGTVDVSFVAADGQVARLPDAYSFVAPPVISSFDPTTSPGAGGVTMTLRGTGFQTGVPDLYEILVGGVPCSQLVVLDGETITARVPAHVSGPKAVVLRNVCGEDVVAPGVFTYGTGLFITTVRPEAVPTFGGVPVTISGSNFSLTDQVVLDGNPIATTPVQFQGSVIAHRIEGANLPAHAPGTVNITVQAQSGASTTKLDALAYYAFSDVTATAIPAASTTDDWGGVSSALIDKDSDGTIDWIVITHTGQLSGTRPGTRVLKNNGTGTFSDVTATAMPQPTLTEHWGGNAVLAGRLNSDVIPDLYLSRPGSGIWWASGGWNEARLLPGNRYVDPWGMLIFPDSAGIFQAQTVSGSLGLLNITGLIVCNATWACAGVARGSSVCRLYDYDFRSVNAAMGDLDGDFDQDVVLVNDSSLANFTGTSVGTWVSCEPPGTVDYQYYTATAFGHATRILATGSNGGLTDRTEIFMETLANADEDFRAVAAAVADVTGDFLNDILIVHNQGITRLGNPVSAARMLFQKNSGTSVTFKQNTQFFPAVSAGSDDFRGDAIAAADLNVDFYRDVIVSLDGDPVGSATYSTRILLQDPISGRLVNRTNTVLAGLLPAGDVGKARVVVARDIDRDGDVDLILSTPSSTGTGNRRTRLLLNIGRNESTGDPIFINASSLLPAEASDDGAALSVQLGDVTGDGHLDIVITDALQTGGTIKKRTRIWKQVR